MAQHRSIQFGGRNLFGFVQQLFGLIHVMPGGEEIGKAEKRGGAEVIAARRYLIPQSKRVAIVRFSSGEVSSEIVANAGEMFAGSLSERGLGGRSEAGFLIMVTIFWKGIGGQGRSTAKQYSKKSSSHALMLRLSSVFGNAFGVKATVRVADLPENIIG
jgi:hypothetical protein